MSRAALVTGGGGFIASHLIPHLMADGWQVRTCGRRPRPDWLPQVVDYRVADLAGDDALDPLFDGVTHLFHLAGASSSRSSEEEMLRSNVTGTENVMGAAARAGVERALHMSSTSVYGEEVQLPLPVREDVEPQPSRAYGKAKWLAERAARRHADAGLPLVVVRPVSVHGPGSTKLVASAILDVAIERYAGLPSVVVHREAIEQRVVDVQDVVAACLHLVAHEAAVGRAFNVCVPDYPSSHDVARVLAAEFDLGFELSDDRECGPSFDERSATRERMLAEGMTEDILFTKERFRFMRKVNRNNRLSVDALLGTGFEFAWADLHTSVAAMVAWYRECRWIV